MTLHPTFTGRIAILSTGLAASLALTGCGSSIATSSTSTATVGAVGYAASGDMASASYDSASDTLTITGIPFDNGVAGATYIRDAAQDVNGYKAYVNTNGARDYVALWGVSNAGTGSVSAGVVATGDYHDHGYNGATYGRDGTTAIPTSGIATYTARYAGLLTTEAALGVEQTSGDITIDIDFTDASVEGIMTNHVNETTTTAMDDVELATGSLVDGSFSGVTYSVTPTAPVTPSHPTPNGIYEGIVGGSTGGEIAGIIIIGSGTTATRETGAFVSDSVVILP